MRMVRVALIASVLALSACAADQAEGPTRASPEAVRGRAYAEDTCAACHAIDKGATVSPNPQAPPFQTIADTPGMTRIALSAWIQGAHQSMPQLIIDQDRTDDVWAYLSSLEE